MKLAKYEEYFVSSVDTGGLVLYHHGRMQLLPCAEHAPMRFQSLWVKNAVIC